jgi:hypothetical protein
MVVLMAKAATRTDTEPNKTKSSNKKKVLKKKPEKRGRKSYYDWKVKPKLHLVADWARNGVLDNEIYKKLGVGKDAFYDYKKKYPELRDALQTRDEADAQVEAALFKNACGFHYEESQTLTRYSEKDGTITETRIFKKYKEPDTTAQAIWLNNRRPESWKQKQREYDSNGKDGEPDPITKSILDHVKSLDGEEE